jgi:hypothetical protein
MERIHHAGSSAMSHREYKRGDRVVYKMSKHSTMPGPRAKDILPAPHGDDYSYQVDKYWVVLEMADEGHIVVRTRRGKEHVVPATDPNLRPANWLEKLLYGSRFPKLA